MTSPSSLSYYGTLGEQLEEAEGLLIGLGQEADGASSGPGAAEEHTAPPQAPHGTAAGL